MKFFGGFEYKINKSGRIKELREFATTPRLISLMNENPEPVLALSKERQDEPAVLIGENLKLKALGWRPTLDLEEGLQLTLQANGLGSSTRGC